MNFLSALGGSRAIISILLLRYAINNCDTYNSYTKMNPHHHWTEWQNLVEITLPRLSKPQHDSSPLVYHEFVTNSDAHQRSSPPCHCAQQIVKLVLFQRNSIHFLCLKCQIWLQFQLAFFKYTPQPHTALLHVHACVSRKVLIRNKHMHKMLEQMFMYGTASKCMRSLICPYVLYCSTYKMLE